MDAVERLRERAQNENTFFALRGICSMQKDEIESLQAARAEDQARIRELREKVSRLWAIGMGAAASLEDAANCLRDEDAKRSAHGAAHHVREELKPLSASSDQDYSALNEALAREKQPLIKALENCRLLAAKNRELVMAQHILRFCQEAGATGSPLREEAAAHRAKGGRDA